MSRTVDTVSVCARAVAAGLSLALTVWAGGWRWGRHFAFPILFLLVAVPWPSEPEQAVIQSLMRGVAALSAEVMAVLGVPAVAEGNVLSVRGQFVGVNEACSGIRSLQTTLMAGLFLGELSRLTTVRRLVLLAGGVFIALAANVFRSSVLVWITATQGTATMERWHDITGLVVLLIVFGSLLAFTSLLNRRPAESAIPPAARTEEMTPAMPPRWVVFAALGWLVAVEVGNAWWYGAPAAQPLVTLPRWNVAAPASAPGWEAVPIDERTARMLRYDRGLSLRWQRDDGPGAGQAGCSLFFFRWEPGHTSSLQADMHQPHICLTASGLKERADWGIGPVRMADGLVLPVHRYEFDLHGRSLYVFFVVWQDGVGSRDGALDEPGSRAARFRAVLERRPLVGRQTLEFLVTGPATPEKASQVFEQELGLLIHRLP